MAKTNNINSIVEHINKTLPKDKQSQAKLLLLSILKEKSKNNKGKKNEKTKRKEIELENIEEIITKENEKFLEEKKSEVIGVDKIEINEIDEQNSNIEVRKISNHKEDESASTIKPSKVTSKVKVEQVTNLQQCISENVEFNGCEESVVCSFPVILSQAHIEVSLEAITKFPEEVFTIEDVDKSLSITSCKLIPRTNKIFLEGVVEKRIKYTTVDEAQRNRVCGNIKKLIVHLPFKCSTEVFFVTKPKFPKKSPAIKLLACTSNKHENNENEVSSIQSQQLGDRVYFYLEDMRICELDKKLETKPLENTVHKSTTFKTLKEKTVVNFTLSLLQNQDVFVHNKT